MRIQNIQMLTLTVVVAATWTTNTSAVTDFRGIPFVQGNNVIADGNAMEGRPWFIDIEDQFGGSGSLENREADTRQVGFVPPRLTNPDNGNGAIDSGFLSGTLEELHGRWVGTGDYLVNGGKVSLDSGSGTGGIAYLPWAVMNFGDDYLVEAHATIPVGSSARIGFTGDPASASNDLMDGEFGQIALDVTRDSEDTGTYEVVWDTATGSGVASDSGVVTLPGSDSELRIQLAWNEITNTFDAWLDNTSLGGITALGNDIQVRGTGLQLINGSAITNFRNAVPEPSTFGLLMIGMIVTINFRKRTS